MITGFVTQDTIRPKLVIQINPGKLIPDSVFRRLDEIPAHIRYADSLKSSVKKIIIPEVKISDTTSVCSRNNIADVTFSDPSSFFRKPVPYPEGQFPFQFVKKVNEQAGKQAYTIITPLREGSELALKPLHYDWITILLLFSALLWLIVKVTTRGLIPELTRYLFLRGVNESSSRDIGSLFYWQSTILNFVSFLVISLFAFSGAEYYGMIPYSLPDFVSFLILFGILVLSLTTRHFMCVATGNISGQTDMFNEYLITVYQSYRFSAVIIFWIIVMLLYTGIFPAQFSFMLGIITLAIFYAYRVFRLFLIFLKRNVSVLYLFLYLCALEILPALIIIKYLSGLVEAG
jgi:hypothetical protein